LIGFAAVIYSCGAVHAEDPDFLAIEQILAYSDFRLEDAHGVRFEEDRNKRAWFVTPTGDRIEVKVQIMNTTRESFNEVPRYELVTYQFQKLFLQPQEFVVPPSVIRSQPVDVARTWDPEASEVRKGTGAALMMIQAWVPGAESLSTDIDTDRLATDPAFARVWGNFNTLTYLIRHVDSNSGNVVIVDDDVKPRIYSVDNDVAYVSDEGNVGSVWRKLWTDRLSADLIKSLLSLEKSDLQEALGSIAEFNLVEGVYQPVPPGKPTSRRYGMRHKGEFLQMGLSTREIFEMHKRLKKLQGDIRKDKITALP
jgi:hypothetical protein